jgi:cell division protein FtsB
MSTRQRKQSKIKPFLIPAACLLILGYFAFHAVEGEYGLFALTKLKTRESDLVAELEKLGSEKKRMEKRVALMRPESLDPDMIDEKARESLNMAHPDDRVILLPAIR